MVDMYPPVQNATGANAPESTTAPLPADKDKLRRWISDADRMVQRGLDVSIAYEHLPTQRLDYVRQILGALHAHLDALPALLRGRTERTLPWGATQAELEIAILAEAKRIAWREGSPFSAQPASGIQALADRIADGELAQLAESQPPSPDPGDDEKDGGLGSGRWLGEELP